MIEAAARDFVIAVACSLALAACAAHPAPATAPPGLASPATATGTTGPGRAPCHLTGWPALVTVTAAGTSVTAVPRLTTMFGPYLLTASPVVTITPGAMAEAVFTVSDNPGPGATTCPPPDHLLRVTPPGNTQPAVISAWLPYLGGYLPACTPVWISPVVPSSDLYNR